MSEEWPAEEKLLLLLLLCEVMMMIVHRRAATADEWQPKALAQVPHWTMADRRTKREVAKPLQETF